MCHLLHSLHISNSLRSPGYLPALASLHLCHPVIWVDNCGGGPLRFIWRRIAELIFAITKESYYLRPKPHAIGALKPNFCVVYLDFFCKIFYFRAFSTICGMPSLHNAALIDYCVAKAGVWAKIRRPLRAAPDRPRL